MKKLLILIVSGFVEVGVLQVKATFHHFIASKMSGFVLNNILVEISNPTSLSLMFN